MKKRNGRKIVAIVLVCAIVLGGAGVGGYRYLQGRSVKDVNVYPVDQLSITDSWFDQIQADGLVTTDRMQSVYLTSTMTVTDVFVEEGQQLAVGDPILAFDTTLDEVKLEKKRIEVEQTKLDLADAQEHLAEIGTYGVGTPYFPEPEPTEEPQWQTVGAPYFQGGSGSQSDPYVYMWAGEMTFYDAMVDYLIGTARGDAPPYPEPPTEPTPIPVPSPPVPTEEVPEAEPSETPVPSPESTAAPTQEPDAEPTQSPEAGPTQAPEAGPTQAPDTEPTQAPDTEPTQSPEAEPTQEPTQTPGPTPVPEDFFEDRSAREILEQFKAWNTSGELKLRYESLSAEQKQTISKILSAEELAALIALLREGGVAEPSFPVAPAAPTAEPTAEPTPEPTAESTPEPTAEPTPEPTAEPTPEPTAESTPEPTAEPTPEPTAEPTPAPTAEPTPEPTPEPTAEPTPEPVPEPETTEGSSEPTAAASDSAPIAAASGAARAVLPVRRAMAPRVARAQASPYYGIGPVYMVFEIRDHNALNGDILSVFEIAFHSMLVGWDEGGLPITTWLFQVLEPSYMPLNLREEEPMDFPYYDVGTYYPLEEINRMKLEAQQQITDLTTQLKLLEQELKQIEFELSNGEVLCEVPGVVKTLRTPEDALAENMPLAVISGGGGYIIKAAMGEFELDSLAVGDTVKVSDWMSGANLDGTITSIDRYPVSGRNYWFSTDGRNSRTTLYPFTVAVSEDAPLRVDYSVTVDLASASHAGADEGDDGEEEQAKKSFYLQNEFLRTENGRSYVYAAGEDGLLEKRYLTTGKSYNGWATEILSGLDVETDYVAFPYGRGLKDGAKVVVQESLESLYNSY